MVHTLQELIDNRNISDQFKGMSDDFVRGEQEKRRTELVTIAINLTHDFNKASVLRTHSSYAGKEFIFLNRPNNQDPDNVEGTKQWDKRGAVGVQNYNTVTHANINLYKDVFARLVADGYTIYAVDNIPGYEDSTHNVFDVRFPLKTALIMGEEKTGIPLEIIEASHGMVYIPQVGVSPRSLNVSVAHGIVSSAWLSQHHPNG